MLMTTAVERMTITPYCPLYPSCLLSIQGATQWSAYASVPVFPFLHSWDSNHTLLNVLTNVTLVVAQREIDGLGYW